MTEYPSGTVMETTGGCLSFGLCPLSSRRRRDRRRRAWGRQFSFDGPEPVAHDPASLECLPDHSAIY
jgi:hypothetical protein